MYIRATLNELSGLCVHMCIDIISVYNICAYIYIHAAIIIQEETNHESGSGGQERSFERRER